MHDMTGRLFEPSDVDNLLHLDPGTTDIAISDLHSIVSLGPIPRLISFHHKSMEDFLMSSSRAGDLYQDAVTTNLRIMEAHCRLSKLEITGSEKANNQLSLAVLQVTIMNLPKQQIFEMGDFVLETLPRYMEEACLATISEGQMPRLLLSSRIFLNVYHPYAVRFEGPLQ
jgi:hypothetical protein